MRRCVPRTLVVVRLHPSNALHVRGSALRVVAALAALAAPTLLVGGLAGCGEFQPIEYTRASTTTIDPAEDPSDPAVVGDEPPEMRSARYTVEPGDSLSSIATELGVNIDVLMAVNNITDPNALEAGVILRVPGPNDTAPAPWQQEEQGTR